MNLSLQDPFAVAKEYPDTLTNTLHYGHSVVIQFNYKGDYLASGLSDGSIVIYDLSSNATIVGHLHDGGHIRPISSISWSSCSRYLLTASQDWYVKLWDLSKINQGNLKGGSPIIREVRFDGPIWLASLHPLDHFRFTASIFEDDAVFVDLTEASDIKINRLQTASKGSGDSNANGALEIVEDENSSSQKRRNDKHFTLVTTFTPSGDFIFSGTNKGWLNVISSESLLTVHSIKFTNSNIKNLVISPNGRKLAINSSDRIIRQVNLPYFAETADPDKWEFEVEHKYQDVVNRLQWNLVAFNHNAEFLAASTFGQSSQDLYVWETSMGSLIRILEGSPEELLDVKWDYHRCTIGSTGLDSGCVYLWLVNFPQKWSALAPDFVEIEENIEYEEKEDEFDLIDEVVLNKRRMEEEDAIVDIVSKETVDARGFEIIYDSFIIPINYVQSLVELEQ